MRGQSSIQIQTWVYVFLLFLGFSLSSCATSFNNLSNVHVSKKMFRLADGYRMVTRYYERMHPTNERVIIIVPGLFQNKDTRAFKEIAKSLTPDFDVISVDLRGQGESEGHFRFGQSEIQDLKVVLDYANSRYPYVGILGFSMGGAITVGEVAQYHNAHSLMLISTPADLEKAEKGFWQPKELFFTLSHFEIKKPLRWDKIDLSYKTIEQVSKIHDVPMFFVHGSDDAIVEKHHSEELYKKAEEPKKLVIIHGGLHAEKLFLSDKVGFQKMCLDWFSSTLRPPDRIQVGHDFVQPVWQVDNPTPAFKLGSLQQKKQAV